MAFYGLLVQEILQGYSYQDENYSLTNEPTLKRNTGLRCRDRIDV
ncbi:MAG: hypothetical protein MjAS7_0943 [Metallosphaera javensis (ex Sakai et al. 2022)]|nr:MAG: hypothetical protein MjAS7_0943 [Metallosphaera javensis (ex Sakai et al. 2022)]